MWYLTNADILTQYKWMAAFNWEWNYTFINELLGKLSLAYRQIIQWHTFNKSGFILKSSDWCEHPMAVWILIITSNSNKAIKTNADLIPLTCSGTLFNPSHAESILGKTCYNCIFYNNSTLRWHRWLNSFLVEANEQLIQYSRYQECWWTCSATSQAISCHGIAQVRPEYSGLSTRRVQPFWIHQGISWS